MQHKSASWPALLTPSTFDRLGHCANSPVQMLCRTHHVPWFNTCECGRLSRQDSDCTWVEKSVWIRGTLQ